MTYDYFLWEKKMIGSVSKVQKTPENYGVPTMLLITNCDNIKDYPNIIKQKVKPQDTQVGLKKKECRM